MVTGIYLKTSRTLPTQCATTDYECRQLDGTTLSSCRSWIESKYFVPCRWQNYRWTNIQEFQIRKWAMKFFAHRSKWWCWWRCCPKNKQIKVRTKTIQKGNSIGMVEIPEMIKYLYSVGLGPPSWTCSEVVWPTGWLTGWISVCVESSTMNAKCSPASMVYDYDHIRIGTSSSSTNDIVS